MSAKITFREGKRIRRGHHPDGAYWHGEFANVSDDELGPELADIIQTGRGEFATQKPPAQDVRATLRALAKISDHEAQRAVRASDDWTQLQLTIVAGRAWRKENPDMETPVPNWVSPCKWTPDRIRETAKLAIKTLPIKSGRHQKQANDLRYSIALVHWWKTHKSKPPTVTIGSATSRESEFLAWATDMFHRAGRISSAPKLIDSASIARTLRQACKIVHKPETRTE